MQFILLLFFAVVRKIIHFFLGNHIRYHSDSMFRISGHIAKRSVSEIQLDLDGMQFSACFIFFCFQQTIFDNPTLHT